MINRAAMAQMPSRDSQLERHWLKDLIAFLGLAKWVTEANKPPTAKP